MAPTFSVFVHLLYPQPSDQCEDSTSLTVQMRVERIIFLELEMSLLGWLLKRGPSASWSKETLHKGMSKRALAAVVANFNERRLVTGDDVGEHLEKILKSWNF